MNNAKLTLSVLDVLGAPRWTADGDGSVELTVGGAFRPGDRIVLCTDKWPVAVRLRIDDKLPAADLWLAGDRMDFPIPFGEERMAYPPEAFCAVGQKLSARCQPEGWTDYRNLSINPLDRRGETDCYPHCFASVETRDESVFAARNTIDGSLENSSHGVWPYTSWGDNEDASAEITIRFGRTVRADKVEILIRADFPHDNHWERATLVFSNGDRLPIRLRKTAEMQIFPFAEKHITWVKLTDLVRADDPSPFPALTHWSVWGSEFG